MTSIAKTGFFTALTGYIIFALADYVRPGFVSYVFSVHWFLLFAIIFGIWWGFIAESLDENDSLILKLVGGTMVKIVLSTIILIIFWRVGEVFGDMRGFLAIVAATSPWVLSRMLNQKQES